MEWKDRMDEEGAVEFVEQVLCHLDQPALGVAKFYVAKGLGALSEKQQFVLERYVFDVFARENCSDCCGPIPWSEMHDAYHNSGRCGYCEHRLEKMLAE